MVFPTKFEAVPGNKYLSISKVLLALAVNTLISTSTMSEIYKPSPEEGASFSIKPQGNQVLIFADSNDDTPIKTIEIDTENEIKITFDDYNFDGFKDFSAWHTDDGMRTYTIHRVFIYSSIGKKFHEIKPTCSDQFLNLRVDRRKKQLLSMTHSPNGFKACATKSAKR